MRLGLARAGPVFLTAVAHRRTRSSPNKTSQDKSQADKDELDSGYLTSAVARIRPSMAPGFLMVPLWTTPQSYRTGLMSIAGADIRGPAAERVRGPVPVA